jgi:hypothetical protein
MATRSAWQEVEPCPFLVAVTADWLWLYPTPAYCRRPGGSVRVPARLTFDTVCTTNAYRECPGYRAAIPGETSAAVAAS